MHVDGVAALVTGGASGLGAATAKKLASQGARVVVLDLNQELGTALANEIGGEFVMGNVTDPNAVNLALDRAEGLGEIRVLVHCAGRGGTVRVVDRSGEPGSLDDYAAIVNVNLVGTFNVLRLTSARMATLAATDDARGVCILTASIAAYEGQVGQIAYASSKAGVVGMTLVAARDLGRSQVRVNTIAPGVFDTPILARFSDEQKAQIASSAVHPRRLGRPEDYAELAAHMIANPMLNGEVVRLDAGARMAAR